VGAMRAKSPKVLVRLAPGRRDISNPTTPEPWVQSSLVDCCSFAPVPTAVRESEPGASGIDPTRQSIGLRFLMYCATTLCSSNRPSESLMSLCVVFSLSFNR
jgi:hypothetical protein